MSQSNQPIGLELTVQEILQAAKPHTFTREQQRSRTLLMEALNNAPDVVRNRVAQASCSARQADSARAADRKSKHAVRNASRKRRASVALDNEPSAMPPMVSEAPKDLQRAAHHSPDRDVDHFLDLPTEDEIKDLHRAFLDATSNAALAQDVCASCGRRLMQNELSRRDFLGLRNRHLLYPTKAHPLHALTHGMLLEEQFIEDSGNAVLGWICKHCSEALNRGRRPAYSLANGMWIGPTPTALSMLTIPEQLLIGLRYPRGYVFKLYPRGGKSADHPDALQPGLKGNVTTYMTNVQAVACMLTGQLMPRTPDILPALVAVAFIGQKQISKTPLKYPFRVRRRMVYAAPLELKHVTQHPGYLDIEVDEKTLDTLPEDDIPNQILYTLRVYSNEEAVQRESAGYVPVDNTDASPNCPEFVDDTGSTEDDHTCNQPDVDDGVTDQSSVWAQGSENFPQNYDSNSAAHGPDEGIGPDVIPLEFSGTAAADGTHITPEELVLSAIENLKSNLQSRNMQESGYGVRHGGFARDFGKRIPGTNEDEYENPSTYTFPVLFPFGLGGLEDDREVPVSFVEHTRWCLQYHDRRFRKHHTFPFWAFSIQQKRQALAASKIAIHRHDFEKAAAALSQISVEDLDQATREEEQNLPISNPNVILLRRLIQVTMQRVMGSDASRAINRSKMWSTSLYLGPMVLWITINPADRHDPICQVFAGQAIDMDNFNRLTGPSPMERARNVAQDSYAAAHFFFFLSQTILETLFGFSTNSRLAGNRMGALGLGNAYFGAVEAQGRGSLHLHMVMWLQNSPNASEVTEKLKCPEFRQKVKHYVEHTMHSHINGLEQTVVDCMEPDSSLPWSRPPHPDSPTYQNDLALLELRLARSQQYHQCSEATCLRFDRRTKTLVCRRRAPFPLSPEVEVTETGHIKTKRLIPNLVTWNPTVAFGGRCNNNIQLVSNGSQARDLGFYITNYATKKQARTYNLFALLAKRYRFQSTREEDYLGSRKANEVFVRGCGLAITREQELSGQQVMSYLMGWGDTIQSHTYTPIYWFTVVRALKTQFPELRLHDDRPQPTTVELANNETEAEDQSNGQKSNNDETLRVDVAADGTWYLRSQIVDYQYRGEYLENFNFLEYFVDTYEESLSRTPPTHTNGRGRPQNIRVPYLQPHPRSSTAIRVLRSPKHRNLPNIIGKWFERNDDPTTHDLHCASVLACLKPWRQLADLKDPETTWTQAHLDFENSTNDHRQCIIANMQYYYQCRDAADRARTTDEGTEIVRNCRVDSLDDIEISELVDGIDIPAALMTKSKRDQLEFADQAVKIGRRLGIFAEGGTGLWSATSESVSLATTERYIAILNWDKALHSMNERILVPSPNGGNPSNNGDVSQLGPLLPEGSRATATIEYVGDVEVEHRNDPDISTLSGEQLRAYLMVKNHLDTYNNRDNSPQLLLHIPGEGGTGKSVVIAKITDLFRSRGQLHTLHKAAYTGIAASMIEGSTLHKLAELNTMSKKLSTTKMRRLQETWKHTKWLIIDEISMVSKHILGSVSERIGMGKQQPNENINSIPFAGISVIIAGDFHQFPPVVGRGPGKGALYAPLDPSNADRAATGEWLYSLFEKVIILRTQFRNEDEIWRGILGRVRHGRCTTSDLKILRSLIPKDNEKDTFKHPPWSEAVLVTSRRAVRNRWNEQASRSHCIRTGNRLVVSRALDCYDGKPVSPIISALIASRERPSGGGNPQDEPGGFPEIVYLAKDMPVMVTVNVETEIDVANGSRGIVREIIVHEDEPGASDNSLELNLRRPPACVLVELCRTRAGPIDGLRPGVVPIVPKTGRFELQIGDKPAIRIHREQIPLIPAYAFTDYRAQGQTIPYVIVDIASPPGGITAFNAYVALSRSRSRERCRILRDFKDHLFTRPPSKALKDEDERLEERDRLTKLKEVQQPEACNLQDIQMSAP